jgi:hypothetical protein
MRRYGPTVGGGHDGSGSASRVVSPAATDAANANVDNVSTVGPMMASSTAKNVSPADTKSSGTTAIAAAAIPTPVRRYPS